ncbi:MAG: hypothetical protein WB998_08940 [Solirubrobacteraceae bacterium]
MNRLQCLLAAVVLCGCLSPGAQAAQSVRLDATLSPERLGRETTVGFGVQIVGRDGQSPSPLTDVEVRYPDHLGLALSGLGFANCSPTRLEADGGEACPANSLMGYGTATAAIPVGPSDLYENAHVTVFRGPAEPGEVGLLFHVQAESPVSAELVFPGLLLSAAPPFSGSIDIKVPIVPGLPYGPNVAVIKLAMTVGPTSKIFYYEHVHGKTVRYHPRGVLLPDSCPPGGFPFAATFGFEDGSHAEAQTKVPCPGAAGGTAR